MMNHIYEQEQFGENWFTYKTLYSSIVNEFPSGSKFVEVGCWKGKSSSYMAVEIKNSNKNIEFYCVDHWMGSQEHIGFSELDDLYDIFISNMKPVEEYYTPLRMTSVEASNTFEDESLDFVFIDASHEYLDVKTDIKSWLPKVKPGGILAGHDYTPPFFPQVVRAVHDSFGDYGFSPLLDIRCWIHRKPLSMDAFNV